MLGGTLSDWKIIHTEKASLVSKAVRKTTGRWSRHQMTVSFENCHPLVLSSHHSFNVITMNCSLFPIHRLYRLLSSTLVYYAESGRLHFPNEIPLRNKIAPSSWQRGDCSSHIFVANVSISFPSRSIVTFTMAYIAHPFIVLVEIPHTHTKIVLFLRRFKTPANKWIGVGDDDDDDDDDNNTNNIWVERVQNEACLF